MAAKTSVVQSFLSSTEWIDAYWSGRALGSREPHWELLMHGRAVICGTELRKRAYEIVEQSDPLAVSILEISRLAAGVGSDLGNTRAYLVNNGNGTASIKFFLDMRDADDPVFLESLRLDPGPRNYSDLAVGGDKFALPDCRKYVCTFAIESPLSESFLKGVHANE